MLPDLNAFKMLFYVESVSVVTSNHVIKMAVTPFDQQLPMLYANFTTLSFTETDLLPIEVLHCLSRKFLVFFAKRNVEII